MVEKVVIGEIEIKELVRDHAATEVGLFPAIASMCLDDSVNELSSQELGDKINSISFEHKASTPTDDDEYWMAQSPFNGKYYIFASCAQGGGYPSCPSYILDEPPGWFYED